MYSFQNATNVMNTHIRYLKWLKCFSTATTEILRTFLIEIHIYIYISFFRGAYMIFETILHWSWSTLNTTTLLIEAKNNSPQHPESVAGAWWWCWRNLHLASSNGSSSPVAGRRRGRSTWLKYNRRRIRRKLRRKSQKTEDEQWMNWKNPNWNGENPEEQNLTSIWGTN